MQRSFLIFRDLSPEVEKSSFKDLSDESLFSISISQNFVSIVVLLSMGNQDVPNRVHSTSKSKNMAIG